MSAACLAMSVESLGLVKLLAVAGGAAVGALVSGGVVQLAVRLLSRQKMPRWAVLFVRLLGGGVLGWVVALWVFGGGGSGFGGPGGGWFGLGGGPGGPTQKAPEDHPRGEGDKKGLPIAGDSLRVEVLGPDTLKALAVTEPARCYRVETTEGTKLVTLGELKDLVRERKKHDPPLKRLVIVLYKDSPDRRTGLVNDLKTFAADRLGDDRVDFDEPGSNAPVR